MQMKAKREGKLMSEKFREEMKGQIKESPSDKRP